jgi:hypothetical protein
MLHYYAFSETFLSLTHRNESNVWIPDVGRFQSTVGKFHSKLIIRALSTAESKISSKFEVTISIRLLQYP